MQPPSLLLTLLLSVLLTGAGCQPRVPPHAPGPWTQPARAGSVVAEGVVLSVERPRPEDSQAYVHVVLEPSGGQPVRLVLAPGWYLDREGIRFDPRDPLRVEGKRASEEGTTTIVVERLQQGERSYVLRDEQERPAWLEP